MSLPTFTRKVIRQECLERIDYPAWPTTGVVTSDGSTTKLTDKNLAGAADSEDFVRAWVYLASKPTDSAEIGEIARIINTVFTGGSSDLTLSPAMSAIIKDTAEYEIHRNIRPDILHRYIDRALGEIERHILINLTDVTGGDMLGTVTTDWVSGSNATPAAETTIVKAGTQSLKVTSSADNGYVKNNTALYYPEKTGLFVSADYYVTSGDSAKLILYDITNSTEIETATSAISGWGHFAFQANTPANCEQVEIRLESQTNGDVIYWDHITILPINKNRIKMPDAIEYPSEVRGLFEFPRGRGMSGSNERNSFVVDEGAKAFLGHTDSTIDDAAVIPAYIERLDAPIHNEIWVEAIVDYDKFGTGTASVLDATDTTAPLKLIVSLVWSYVLEDYIRRAFEQGDKNLAIGYQTIINDVYDEISGERRKTQIKEQALIIGAFV